MFGIKDVMGNTRTGKMSHLVPFGNSRPSLPALVVQAGPKAKQHFWEFFTAQIRNKNTRQAYGRAASTFLAWFEDAFHLPLEQIEPLHVAAYIELVTQRRSRATAKLHLAAIRRLFDWLYLNRVLASNPAAPVRGPKVSNVQGKTPVLTEAQAARLLDSIDASGLTGLRDRALIGVMLYTWARVGAVVRLRVKDYQHGRRIPRLQLHEKGSKAYRVDLHPVGADYLDGYIDAAGIRCDRAGPLFRSFPPFGRGPLTARPMDRRGVAYAVKRRCANAGLPPEISPHSMRGTGITVYLQRGGSLDVAQRWAGHADARTTRTYDHRCGRVPAEETLRLNFART